MKIFRNILLGILVFLFLICSCSGGIDPGGGSPQQEKEGIEKEVENPDEDEDEDETEEDETEDSETKDNETKNIDNISREIPPAPIFLYCKTVSENKIVFGFSQPVTMVSLDFDIELNYEKSGKGKTITVNLAEDLENGKIFTADFLAEDAYGNRVKKQVSFFSTASSAPALQINELRTEYSGSSLKAEFIEFKMLSDGNLGGLRVFVAGNNKNPMLYEFASVEVKAGEYVVLHLRKLEEASKDEYGVKLDESGGTDSSPTARDFWIPGSSKLLHKTDAVYVLDQNGWTLDAVMIAENSDSWLKKDYFVKTAEFLFEHNAWKSATGTVSGVADAVDSSGIKTAITRSISRKELTENTHTAADWYVTATSGVSPGLRNKP